MPFRHFLRHFVENRPPKKCRFGIFYGSRDDRVKFSVLPFEYNIHLPMVFLPYGLGYSNPIINKLVYSFSSFSSSFYCSTWDDDDSNCQNNNFVGAHCTLYWKQTHVLSSIQLLPDIIGLLSDNNDEWWRNY